MQASRLVMRLISSAGIVLILAFLLPSQAVADERSCKELVTSSWSTLETWIWEKLCSSGYADLDAYDRSHSPHPQKREDWHAARTVSSEFLTEILTEARYANALKRPSLIIKGIWVRDSLNLSYLTIEPSFSFRFSRFEAQVSLVDAVANGKVDFRNSEFLGGLALQEANISGITTVNESRLKSIDANFAKIDGYLSLAGSTVLGEANFDSSVVSNSVFLNGSAKFSTLKLNHTRIAGNLYIDADIGGDLSIRSARIERELRMLEAKISGKVFINSSAIGENLWLFQTKASEDFVAEAVEVGDSVFISNTSISGNLDLRHVHTGGGLYLAASTMSADVLCSGSTIEGILTLRQSQPQAWGPSSLLNLSATSVGGINDSEAAWPTRLALDGFTYKSASGEQTIGNEAEGKPFLERSGDWYTEWLERSPYSRQAYKEMETALRAVGNKKAADDVAIAGQDRARASSAGPVSFLYRNTVGYGYRPLQAALPAAVLVIAGIAVLSRLRYDRHEVPSAFILSVQRLIPLVTFGENYSKFDLTSGSVPKWIRRYFYFHSFCGYLLAGFLLAGLARITTTG
jgi:hypothetical protein